MSENKIKKSDTKNKQPKDDEENITKYIKVKDICAISIKINPTLKDRLYAHAELTSCHLPPPKYKTWIGVWREAVYKATNLEEDDKIVRNKQNIIEAVGGCSFVGCSGSGVLGAHVWYVGSLQRFSSWYIVPACNKCNRQHGMGAPLKPGTVLMKVVEGNILLPNSILIGYLKTLPPPPPQISLQQPPPPSIIIPKDPLILTPTDCKIIGLTPSSPPTDQYLTTLPHQQKYKKKKQKSSSTPTQISYPKGALDWKPSIKNISEKQPDPSSLPLKVIHPENRNFLLTFLTCRCPS